VTLREQLFAYFAEHHPRSMTGVEEARAVDPARFDQVAERFLSWGIEALGQDFLKLSADAYVTFSSDVILEQGRYELRGRYTNDSFEACKASVYHDREVMDEYLWGVYVTNFLWAHHMELSIFFEDRFLKRLPASPKLVEIAPGHGGWGAWALHNRPDATLQGYDISPSSIDIATRITKAAGVSDRATYTEQNALDLSALPEASADALICSFLVEHLEQPEQLFAVIGHVLKPGGFGFVTGALTAAQIDHIYEFKRESELILLAEANGLRVVESLSTSPRRILPKAKELPRSMGMLVQRRTQNNW